MRFTKISQLAEASVKKQKIHRGEPDLHETVSSATEVRIETQAVRSASSVSLRKSQQVHFKSVHESFLNLI